MSVDSSDIAVAGTYNVEVKVTLVDYPSITKTKSFTITIKCVVTSLTFVTTPPASTTLTVGIDSQPLSIPFTTTQYPACGNSVSFNRSPN